MEYLLHLATLAALFAVFAVSLNLVSGYAGLISLAQAAFYGLGGYATAILVKDYHFNFFIALLFAALVASATAFVIGWVFSRFRGDYYVLGTVGFAYITYTAMMNLKDLTGGPLGIPGIPRPEVFGFSFGDSALFLALCLAVLGAVFLVSRFIVASHFGRILKAIREDEGVVPVFGYRILSYKLAVFVFAAAIAAIGGGLLASYLTYIDPRTFAFSESVFVLSMVILGGLGSLRGPVVGAVILILLPEALRFVGFSPDIAAQMRALLYGLALVLLMRFRPQGIMGEYKL